MRLDSPSASERERGDGEIERGDVVRIAGEDVFNPFASIAARTPSICDRRGESSPPLLPPCHREGEIARNSIGGTLLGGGPGCGSSPAAEECGLPMIKGDTGRGGRGCWSDGTPLGEVLAPGGVRAGELFVGRCCKRREATGRGDGVRERGGDNEGGGEAAVGELFTIDEAFEGGGGGGTLGSGLVGLPAGS